jgi:23S rRNA (guanosine2251-2'-O)-methyltransferase
VADAGKNFVYGLRAVAAVLSRSPERVLELWLKEPRTDRRAQAVKEAAQTGGVRVQVVAPEVLAKLVGDVAHQGVVASLRPMAAWNDDQLLAHVDALQRPAFLLVLDGVTDPHNLGACLRSADAAGIDAVVTPKDRSAGVDGVVRKVAAGAAEFVRFAAVTNLARTLDALKERNIWVVGLDGSADKSLFAADLKGALTFVLGAEGEGMRRLTRERCDFLVRIPMAGQVESLNVSVSAGVALFEAVRQRSR